MTDRAEGFMARYAKSYGRTHAPQKPNYDLCCSRVSHGFRSDQCARKNGQGPDGAYCKQHDPAAKAARRAALDEKWEKETARNRRSAKFQADCIRYVRSIAAGMTDNDGAEARRILAEFEVQP